VNKKGYKVLRGVGVIQGDGININTLGSIICAVEKAGFSAQNVAYGMGGGLLQKVNRDTMSFAVKLSKIIYDDNVERCFGFNNRDVMKMPKGSSGKRSFPGEFRVIRDPKFCSGIPTVLPFEFDDGSNYHNELEIVYDKGAVRDFSEDFDTIRKRINQQWKALPLKADVISAELHEKVIRVEKAQTAANLANYTSSQ
jgi:nicotinamide phosphoribosyltransferase